MSLLVESSYYESKYGNVSPYSFIVYRAEVNAQMFVLSAKTCIILNSSIGK